MSSQRQTEIEPPTDTRIQPGDHLIAIARDNEAIKLSASQEPEIDQSAIQISTRAALNPKKFLILGWNWQASTMIEQLDYHVAPGSVAVIAAETKMIEEEVVNSPRRVKISASSFRKQISPSAVAWNVWYMRHSTELFYYLIAIATMPSKPTPLP